MTMLPGDGAGTAPARVSLIPLRDLLTMSTGQVVGNLLVFAALGFLAPLRFAALASVPRLLALAASCSALVETAQYVLRPDRVSSVDDVLLNTAGAGLAALASRPWWRAAATAPSPRSRTAPAPRRRTVRPRHAARASAPSPTPRKARRAAGPRRSGPGSRGCGGGPPRRRGA
ncbi:VanZ family protein [Streptomyces sp. ISL-12]|uniref:VanZ family protein n=1 Tax=Streptomyces sp. ISL-12 TaxID=2819177 RepID=UPI0027BAEAF8|nr:VanZ family protein [Streptomyces sp. ISL-12]